MKIQYRVSLYRETTAVGMVLYVAYYRMDEMKAFYAAMVPLVTEAVTMAVVVGMVLKRS